VATNLVTYYKNSTAQTAREAEVPLADFDNGANQGASNAPGIGVNTGNYDPKASDWPRVERMQNSQIMGEDADGLNCKDATFGDTALVGFAVTTSATAADGTIDADVAGTGFAIVNRTGVTIPDATWCWGVADNP
jgi:hypothetical protein